MTETIVPVENAESVTKNDYWQQWLDAFKQIWPIYLSTHIVFFILTYLSNLFLVGNFSTRVIGLHMMIDTWGHWDTGHFVFIATHGYDAPWRTAFFPLFPLFMRGVTFLTKDPVVAGLIVANLATLVLFMVLYRLVQEDFGQEVAWRCVLYLAIFPTAFFLLAPYNESIFLCLTLLSFYQIRRGEWWWAGLFGMLAALTRSIGILIFVPFFYEYLRQHDFTFKKIRLDIVSCLLIPVGLGLFALYCDIRFHDPLSFSQAQSVWNRTLRVPGEGFAVSLKHIVRDALHHQVLNFASIHNVIDLTTGLLILCTVVLSFVGPWKFRRDRWAYPFYGGTLYLFLILFPSTGILPLQSLSRLLLEVFPAFIVLASMGKKAQFNLYYGMISGAVLCFMLLQYLAGYWIV